MVFDAEQFKANLTGRLRRQYGKDISQASKHDLFDAVSASALEIIMPNWMETRREYEAKPTKQLYYLSAEFLMGRALSNNLINAGIDKQVKEVLKGMNIDYNIIEDEEPDAGLGNGGLGRLAAADLAARHGEAARHVDIAAVVVGDLRVGHGGHLAAHGLRHAEARQQTLSGLFIDLRYFSGQIHHHGDGVFRH